MSQSEVWPNFFVVGTPRAGTTSIYEYLKDVPEIYMSPVKEPHYFSKLTRPKSLHTPSIQNKEDYLKLFDGVTNEKIIGDASTSYLSDPQAPFLIHQINPSARILISLRDPVERVFSHFLMIRQGESLKNDFFAEIQSEKKFGIDYTKENIGLEHGLYFDKVKMYLDIFDKKNVHIIFFEDLIQNTTDVMNEIMRFLNIDYSFNDYNFIIHNKFMRPKSKIISQTLKKHKGIKKFFQKSIPFSTRKKISEMLISNKNKPKMNSTERKFLIEFYSNDVSKLKTLIDRDLLWKNFQNLL